LSSEPTLSLQTSGLEQVRAVPREHPAAGAFKRGVSPSSLFSPFQTKEKTISQIILFERGIKGVSLIVSTGKGV